MNLAVTGHRPPKIGGYSDTSPLRMKVREAMREKLLEMKPDYGISGMALGVDQDFAFLCVDLNIPFIAAIPFKGQESMWPPASQEVFQKLLSLAYTKEIISQGGFASWKMQKRNQWMVNQCHKLLAVWDGSDGGTANCVKYAEEKNVEIIRINPKDLNNG